MKILPVILLSLLAPLGARTQDVVVLKTGEELTCRLDGLTDRIVNITVLGSGGGSAARTLPAETVERIEFGFREGEEALFSRRSSAASGELKGWWDHHFPHLHRPRSRAGSWGIAYAEALLREEGGHGPTKAANALALLDLVLERSWSPQDRAEARRGRVHALLATGDLENAALAAKGIAEEEGDPTLTFEVGYRQALADFSELRRLVEEHPRWEEDDEVRPRHDELFHRALDRFLSPHLFHATKVEVAARGLYSAAELYLFAGAPEEARSRWDDLLRLYPESPSSGAARERLASLAENPAKPE